MPDRDRPYVTWLLRLWRVEDDGATLWRASLENAQTGERYGFAGVDGLFGFLTDLVSGQGRPPTTPAWRREANSGR